MELMCTGFLPYDDPVYINLRFFHLILNMRTGYGGEGNKMEGIVKRWVTSYGFIEVGETGKDVFVHESDVKSNKPLSVGQKVKFDMEEGERGPKAVNVEVIE